MARSSLGFKPLRECNWTVKRRAGETPAFPPIKPVSRRIRQRAPDFSVADRTQEWVAGAGGIEPPNGGIKIRLIIQDFKAHLEEMSENAPMISIAWWLFPNERQLSTRGQSRQVAPTRASGIEPLPSEGISCVMMLPTVHSSFRWRKSELRCRPNMRRIFVHPI